MRLAGRWEPESRAMQMRRTTICSAVGTLEPRKNLRRVIGVCGSSPRPAENPRSIADRRTARLGDSGIDRLLTEHPEAIQWVGYVPDSQLRELYRRAKALIYPSLYEGFGLPVVEAMSLGCPVITSRRSSLPEVGGGAAIYVDAEDVKDIAQAIRNLLSHPSLRPNLQERGRAQAAKFSWRRCADETVAVYEQVLGQPAF